MNIFATSDDPIKCAEALDDKRVVKMVLETAQLICTVLHQRGILDTPYRPTHEGNKLVKWAHEPAHLYWLQRHGFALDAEYSHRFGGRHKSGEVIDWARQHVERTKDQPEWFVNAASHRGLGLDYSHKPVHAAYRHYLIERWYHDTRKPLWTNRQSPKWMTRLIAADLPF